MTIPPEPELSRVTDFARVAAIAATLRRALHRRYLVTLVLVGVASLGGLALTARANDADTAGAKAELRALEAQSTELRGLLRHAMAARVAAVSASDAATADARQQIGSYRKALAAAGLRVDTLRATDTVRVLASVLLEGEAAVNSCTEALSSCEVAKRALLSENALLARDTTLWASRVAATRRLIPTTAQQLAHDAKLGGVIGLTVYLLTRFHVLP